MSFQPPGPYVKRILPFVWQKNGDLFSQYISSFPQTLESALIRAAEKFAFTHHFAITKP
jgi:hypothetical protein